MNDEKRNSFAVDQRERERAKFLKKKRIKREISLLVGELSFERDTDDDEMDDFLNSFHSLPHSLSGEKTIGHSLCSRMRMRS